jgi:hypothetical protein
MLTRVTDINEGDWVQMGRHAMRVVEVMRTRFDRMEFHLDFGNGGEPNTSFFDTDDFLQVVPERVL